MSKELQELQKQWRSVMQTIHSNANVFWRSVVFPFHGTRKFKRYMSVVSRILFAVKRSKSAVVAFMNSRVGQYLDDHPFIALSLLMFVAVSAIPVAFFLIFVITTAIMSCISVIVMEGVVIAVGGISLLCVLCGLGALSLGVSGILSVGYVVISTLVNYWYASKGQIKKHEASRGWLQKSPPVLDLSSSNGKNE